MSHRDDILIACRQQKTSYRLSVILVTHQGIYKPDTLFFLHQQTLTSDAPANELLTEVIDLLTVSICHLSRG